MRSSASFRILATAPDRLVAARLDQRLAPEEEEEEEEVGEQGQL